MQIQTQGINTMSDNGAMDTLEHYRFYVVDNGVKKAAACKSSLEAAIKEPAKLFIRGVKQNELVSIDEIRGWRVGSINLNRKARNAVADAVETLEIFQIEFDGLDKLKELIQVQK